MQQQSLVSKVDCDFFDEEVHNLKSMITALASTTNEDNSKPIQQQVIQMQPGLSSKDSNKLKEVSEKVHDFEIVLTKLLK